MKLLVILFVLFSSSNVYSLSNSTLGQVGEEIITTRDVEIHYMVVHSLYHYKSKASKFPLNKSVLNKEISSFMLEEMVFQEAKEFQLAKVPRAEIMKKSTMALSRILRSPYAKVWKAWKVETVELDKFIHRNLRARKLISVKRKSAEVLVSEAEVDNYLKANEIKEEDRENKLYRKTVKSFLGRKQGEQRLREWFQVLKSKYKVKVF